MAHLLVGDGHYNNRPGELERWLALVERAIALNIQEVSILGDFFELWIALPGLMPPWQQPFIDSITDLRRRGVFVRYVVGNKDYHVESWNRRSGVFDEVVSGSTIVPSPMGPLYLAHGDQVNTADYPYRLWRAFSRSALVTLVARLVPAVVLQKLAEWLARRLQRTNLAHKSYYPQEALVALASRMGHACSVMVFGHFHDHRHFQGGRVQVVTLPFLWRENAGLLLTEQGLERFEAAA